MKNLSKAKLTSGLRIRLTQKERGKLDQLLAQSAHDQTLSELVRTILFKRSITVNSRNASLDEVKEELIGIRSELRRIGININQVVHYFNLQDQIADRFRYGRQIADLYQPVITVSQELAEKLDETLRLWLPK